MSERGVLRINGVRLDPLLSGALFWSDEETLIVSDLHFEKGSSFAKRGVFLPPYDTRTTLKRLAEDIARHRPTRVVSLGDAFHDRDAEARMDEADAALLASLVSGRDWIWIIGNHDPAPPKRFSGEVVAAKRIGPLVFRHEPSPSPSPGEIAGHLHPCARVAGQRRRCFAGDGERLVMPAFGAYAGGLNVLDTAFASLFGALIVWVMGRARIYPVGPRHLSPDALTPVRLWNSM